MIFAIPELITEKVEVEIIRPQFQVLMENSKSITLYPKGSIYLTFCVSSVVIFESSELSHV